MSNGDTDRPMIPLNWTAVEIKEQWLKDRDTARAIQRAEFQLRKMEEGSKTASRFLDPSVLYMGHAEYVTPKKLSEPFQEQAALLALIQELQENLPANVSLNDQPSPIEKELSRIPWKGGRSNFGRVYIILQKYLGCTPAEWERHFSGKGGKSMKGAVSDAGREDISHTTSSEIVSLNEAAKDFKPE